MKTLLPILLVLPFLIHAQKEKVVSLNPEKAITLPLSQIAEKVTPISLKDYDGAVQFVYMTDDGLYICGLSTISKLDISGKIVKTVNCGYVSGISGDILKKEIYVSMSGNEADKNKIVCFDYDLKEKKSYKTKYIPNLICYFKDNLWIHSYYADETTRTAYYKISTLDLTTGKESFLNFEISEKSKYPNGIIVYSNATFSVYKDQIAFTNGVDSTIYGIKEGKIYPIVRYKVKPFKNLSYVKPQMATKGFIGKYLLINYLMENKLKGGSEWFCYLEDMNTGNKNDMTYFFDDDIYHTGNCVIKEILNKEGYFYIFRTKEELSKVSKDLNLSGGNAIFIVKAKK